MRDEVEVSVDGPVVVPSRNLVYLGGSIDDNTVIEVTLGLEMCEGDDVRLIINTPGGSLFGGIALGQCIRGLQARGHRVIGEVRGRCFSSGIIPLLHCAERKMWQGSYLGVHGFSDDSHGSLIALRAEQRLNQGLLAELVSLFETHSKVWPGYWEPILISDVMRYYNAEEALKVGLVDAAL